MSTLKPEDLSVVEGNENLLTYRLISVSLQRDRDGPLQVLSLYPHRHSPQDDPCFGLLYSLVVGGCAKPDLFPKFSREAAIVNRKDKTASRLAAFWTLCFSSLHKEFKSLSEAVNEKLTCYRGRKGANQKLAETSTVSGLAQIFRSGWELCGIHAIFDCVTGSKTLTNQAGKALSGWSCRCKNEIIRGCPLDLKSIRSNPELVSGFVMALFSDNVEVRWSLSIRNVLTATLLSFCEEFLHVLVEHPNSICDDVSRHPLVHAINKALRVANVKSTVFDCWCKEVREGFSVKNLMALPWDMLLNCLHDIKVDPRALFDKFDALAFSYHSLFTQKMNLEHNVSRLRVDVAHLTRKSDVMERALADQNELLARMARALEVSLGKEEGGPHSLA